MKMETIEEEISRTISKYRKDLSGRGPIDTTAKVVGHTIYLKMNLTFSDLERSMYNFIAENNGMYKFNEEFRSKAKCMIDEIMQDYGFSVSTDNMFIQPDLKNDYMYFIFVLSDNLEKMIRNQNKMS